MFTLLTNTAKKLNKSFIFFPSTLYSRASRIAANQRQKTHKITKMVVGEAQNGSVEDAERQQQQHPQPTQHPSINQATIDNIMSGIENTGAVKMNNHRKKLRQR